MDPDADAADVDRVLAGNAEAFAGIVARWQRPLLTLAYRLVRDRHLAEDLAQRALLKTFQALPGWRREGRFSTWLFALAMNLFRSELRRRRLDEVVRWRAALAMSETAPEVEPAADDERVRQAVAALPPRYRDVTVMFYFQDRDIAETAQVLGLPAGTVKARLHRARRLLARMLGRTDEDPTP